MPERFTQHISRRLLGKLQLSVPGMRKRANRIMLDADHKLLYFPIPKNACTFFVRMVLENSRLAESFRQSRQNPHDFRRSATELRLTSATPLVDSSYFRFLVIRDPIERVVSAYLNKFVRNTEYPQAVRATRKYFQIPPQPQVNELLTFGQFVDFLSQEPPRSFDVHWRPQFLLVQPFASYFEIVATMDSIPRLVDLLSERLGRTLPCMPTSNRNDYHCYSQSDNLAEAPPSRLRALERMPAPENLLTPRLQKQLERIYQSDIDFYQHLTKRALASK